MRSVERQFGGHAPLTTIIPSPSDFAPLSGACGRAGIWPAKEWRYGQTDRKAAKDAAETPVQ